MGIMAESFPSLVLFLSRLPVHHHQHQPPPLLISPSPSSQIHLLPECAELMLLAVEGGGFFSSSATGYTRGLTLLLLGKESSCCQQDHQHKPMKVSPWNQYHLVDQEPTTTINNPSSSDHHHKLASGSGRISRGCAAFICFGSRRHSASVQLDCASSPPKFGQEDPLPQSRDYGDDEEVGGEVFCLKSSLKQRSNCGGGGRVVGSICDDLDGISAENGRRDSVGMRKVQWTDACGQELVEVREFEPSDISDDEYEEENERSCACTVM